jgi:SNF2 family DNA or RNA helicase
VSEQAVTSGAQSTVLRGHEWDVAYSHEDGDLVNLFFVPALSRAVLYQRATGYFSGDVLALAARGLDALIARGGRMQLLVGCTLGPADIEEIQKGYDVREATGRCLLNRVALQHEDQWARQKLGYLAWMIAHGFLDVKLAIPLDEHGQMRAGLGLYHAKTGIITDDAGDKLVFKGSINETPSGWLNNCESFDVSCSWRGEWDLKKIQKSAGEFAKLWSGQAKSARVFDFPEALKAKLLEYLPSDDAFMKPPLGDGDEGDGRQDNVGGKQPPGPGLEAEVGLSTDERRRLVWSFIKNAPKRPDGALVAVVTSTVKPWPHQLRAYRRMLDAWPFRLLVADEVGLGKTIEAGLIIRHAWISELAKRVLILAPKGILKQWQAELYEKFNLLVPIYDGQNLCWPKYHPIDAAAVTKIARTEWVKEPIVLVSSHLMRRKDRQQELIDAEGWDLLVLDEAHHARRRSPGSPQEGGPNRLLRLMEQIKEKAKSLLLLTATPMQVHPVELWDLLNLLGVPMVWGPGTFVDYFEKLGRNPGDDDLHRAAKLFQVTEKEYGPAPEPEVQRVAAGFSLGKIDVKKVLAALRDPNTNIPLKRLSTKHRQAAVALLKAVTPIHFRMSRHTRNLLREYHKKGLLDSPIADRVVTDLPVILSPSERQLYEDVERYISTIYQSASPDKKTAVGFVMTIYRRRLASSFYALRKTLENRLARLKGLQPNSGDDERLEEDLPQDEQAEEMIAADEAAVLADKALQVEEEPEIQTLLKSIAKLGTDTKAKELVRQLKKAFADGYDSAIVFTQYTDTMDFLKNYVAEQLDLPVGTYSGRGGEKRDTAGNWAPSSKEAIKRMLRDKSVQVLVCTDAAGEGLNLQTCGVLVNFDLPWNPMKVEQRIGRIDRIGQTYPKVRIVNLAYADTVEADVYFSLSERIGLFQGVVGKLQPILAKLPKEFEASVLRRMEDRDRGRQEAVRNVEVLVGEAEQAAFDIDEVSEADLAPPQFPPPPLMPEDLDRVMHNERLLPPGVVCKELDPRTYAITIPGGSTATRITTSPDVFDDHFESHQLVLYDSPVFKRLATDGASGSDSVDDLAVGSLRTLLDLQK